MQRAMVGMSASPRKIRARYAPCTVGVAASISQKAPDRARKRSGGPATSHHGALDRTGRPGRCGCLYDADRLHRNDLEFFRFMAEMTERQILVFDGNGLISNVDRLSWKIKAIVAQEEREKVARASATISASAAQRQVAGHDSAGLLPRRRQIVEDPGGARDQRNLRALRQRPI